MAATVRIWRAPLMLAAVSTIGLVSALLADGWGDVLSWITLAVPVACVLWYVYRKPAP